MDWGFLVRVLEAFGFNSKVRKINSQLISTPTFAVVVNGTPSDFFKSSRGLCKGEILSPIMFIILAIGLGRLINFYRCRGELVGLKPSSSPLVFTYQ